jgi:hypothetical protein
MPNGFDNDTMFARNWDFRGGFPVNPQVTASGQLPIGTGNTRPASEILVGQIVSPGGTITVGYSSPNITIDLAGGSVGIDSIAVQTGTSPIVPTGAGLVTFNGAVVAAGTNPVRTDGTGANTVALEVQISQALAATDATKIGLANFNSAQFTVDANGFVSTLGSAIPNTITGNSGGALSPTAGNWNILGTGSITTSGAVSTLTIQLTGLTNHAVLVGAGTATVTNVGPTATAGQVLQSAGAAADPAFSTATYPSTTTISQILYSSAANVVSGLATANRAVLTTGATGIPVLTALAANGQLIIGSTAGAPAAATLTAGTGISITNGSNSISIAVSGSAVGQTITGDSGGALSPTAGNWNVLGRSGSKTSGSGSTLTINSPPFADQGGSTTVTLNSGSFATATATLTTPATAGLLDGDLLIFVATTANPLTIQFAATQVGHIGNVASSAAGTFVSTAIGDSVSLRYQASTNDWWAVSSIGNWTIT